MFSKLFMQSKLQHALVQTRHQPFSSSWLQAQISRVHKADPTKTIAIVVDHSEIKDGSLDSKVLPEGLSTSDDFKKDLNLSSSYWFYHKIQGEKELKRVLLLQKGKAKKDAKPEDDRKSYRSLGVTACQQLQAKKASSAEILFSSQVAC